MKFSSVLFTCSLTLSSFAVFADNYFKLPQKGSLAAGISSWNVFDGDHITTANFSYEAPALDKSYYEIQPTLFMAVGEHGEKYFALGTARYFDWTESFSYGISFSAGYLTESEELGYDVEFFTRAILRYRLDSASRLKLEFGHISNAGLGRINPGSENLALYYEVDL